MNPLEIAEKRTITDARRIFSQASEARQDLFKRYIEGLQTTYFGGSEKLLMSNPNEELYRLELLAEQLNQRSVGD